MADGTAIRTEALWETFTFRASLPCTSGKKCSSRFSASRPDVLVYETEELAEPVTVAGHIVAKLFAATSGSDSDFIVKLIDVYPGNAPDNDPNPAGVRMGHFQMLVSGEVFRAKYRNSFSQPAPMVPNQTEPITIDLRDKNHRFLKGHR